MDNVKIGFLTTANISTANGYVTRILEELTQLHRKKISVSILSFLHIKYWKNKAGISNYVETIKDFGNNISVIPVFPDNQNPILYKALDQYCVWQIRRFLRKEHISVLHCQATLSAYLGVLAVTDSKLPVVYDMHGAEIAEQADRWEWASFAMKRLEQTERIAALGSNTVIAVSKALREHMMMKYPGMSPASFIIPCAVNTEKLIFNPSERVKLRSSWNVSDSAPIFVCLGSAVAYQKIDQSLQVFQQVQVSFPDARMLLLSPQTDIGIIKKIARELGIKDGSLLFYSVTHNEVAAYLSACDFGFLLRDNLLLNNVSSPTKFGEYISCGVPVILSPYISDLSFLVDQYKVGIVFEEDLKKLISFVRYVMNNRDELRRNCIDYAFNNYSWDYYGDYLLKAYGSTIHNLSDGL